MKLSLALVLWLLSLQPLYAAVRYDIQLLSPVYTFPPPFTIKSMITVSNLPQPAFLRIQSFLNGTQIGNRDGIRVNVGTTNRIEHTDTAVTPICLGDPQKCDYQLRVLAYSAAGVDPPTAKTFALQILQEVRQDVDLKLIDSSTELFGNLQGLSDQCPPLPDTPERIFRLRTTYTSISSHRISNIAFRIDKLTGGNRVLLVDPGESGGEGSRISPPRTPGTALEDGTLASGESFNMTFWLCLQPDTGGDLVPFEFFVTAFGIQLQ